MVCGKRGRMSHGLVGGECLGLMVSGWMGRLGGRGTKDEAKVRK